MLEFTILNIMIQKKITLKQEHAAFLSACKEFGFSDQSTMVRAALDIFIKDIKRKRRRAKISKKAEELATLYNEAADLTSFTTIDGDDFHETS